MVLGRPYNSIELHLGGLELSKRGGGFILNSLDPGLDFLRT